MPQLIDLNRLLVGVAETSCVRSTTSWFTSLTEEEDANSEVIKLVGVLERRQAHLVSTRIEEVSTGHLRHEYNQHLHNKRREEEEVDAVLGMVVGE